MTFRITPEYRYLHPTDCWLYSRCVSPYASPLLGTVSEPLFRGDDKKKLQLLFNFLRRDDECEEKLLIS